MNNEFLHSVARPAYFEVHFDIVNGVRQYYVVAVRYDFDEDTITYTDINAYYGTDRDDVYEIARRIASFRNRAFMHDHVDGIHSEFVHETVTWTQVRDGMRSDLQSDVNWRVAFAIDEYRYMAKCMDYMLKYIETKI